MKTSWKTEENLKIWNEIIWKLEKIDIYGNDATKRVREKRLLINLSSRVFAVNILVTADKYYAKVAILSKGLQSFCCSKVNEKIIIF